MAIGDYVAGLQRLQRHNDLGGAGNSFLQQNFNPRFAGLSLRNAQDYNQASVAAAGAIGAEAGSIAARNNPLRYGSIASREFPNTFGSTDIQNVSSNLIAQTSLNNANGSVDPTVGLKRRGLYNALSSSAGDESGY